MKIKSHELAHKLLLLPNMDIDIPYDPDNKDYSQPLDNWIIGKSGVVGSSDNPYKETLIFKGKLQKTKA